MDEMVAQIVYLNIAAGHRNIMVKLHLGLCFIDTDSDHSFNS